MKFQPRSIEWVAAFFAFWIGDRALWLHQAVAPPSTGYLVTIGEFFGGLGLIVGFVSRFSALSIIIIMLGAIGMVHAKVGFFMNWTGTQAGEGFEYHLLAIAILITIVIAGRTLRYWTILTSPKGR